jgi:hypothetical protein
MPDTRNPLDQQARINWRGIGLAVLVSLLALLAGVFGSIYSDDIKTAAPFCFFDGFSIHGCYGPVSWHALVFWVFAMAASALFFWAQYDSEHHRQNAAMAAESRRRQASKELHDRADELKELIRTIPPEDFLIAFNDFFRECCGAKQAVPAGSLPPTATVEKAIRIVCGGVAALAQRFDRQPASTLYAVNIMLFRPANLLTEAEIPTLKERLRFITPETDPRTLRGILDLQAELSTSTQDPRHGRDASLEAIALPVPIVEKVQRTGKWRVLPGAPLAFCRNKPDGYQDMKTLAHWCETDGTFDDGIIEEIRGYFDRSTTIRSLIALPLQRFDGSGETIGVLNIHSQLPGLLDVPRMEKQFVPMITPFQAILVDLLDILDSTTRAVAVAPIF